MHIHIDTGGFNARAVKDERNTVQTVQLSTENEIRTALHKQH